MTQENIPQEINTLLNGELYDFAVRANLAQPRKKSLSSLWTGIIFLLVAGFFGFFMFGPLLWGENVHFIQNGVPTVASLSNWRPLIAPTLFVGAFFLLGVGIITSAIYFLFAKGNWFIGTPKRLIIYNKKKTRSIDWEQFNGDVELGGNPDKGTISLKMRTGEMIKRKGEAVYIPEIIYLSEIPNAFEIEKICSQRIKENDPTPPERTFQS